MFEKRAKGNDLAKRISYGYIALAILTIILCLFSSNFPVFLERRGITVFDLIIGAVFYLIGFVILYYLSTKYENYNISWKFYAVFGIITLIVMRNIISLALCLLLLVSANDLRKELN